jgi:hypothetical protein
MWIWQIHQELYEELRKLPPEEGVAQVYLVSILADAYEDAWDNREQAEWIVAHLRESVEENLRPLWHGDEVYLRGVQIHQIVPNNYRELTSDQIQLLWELAEVLEVPNWRKEDIPSRLKYEDIWQYAGAKTYFEMHPLEGARGSVHVWHELSSNHRVCGVIRPGGDFIVSLDSIHGTGFRFQVIREGACVQVHNPPPGWFSCVTMKVARALVEWAKSHSPIPDLWLYVDPGSHYWGDVWVSDTQRATVCIDCRIPRPPA